MMPPNRLNPFEFRAFIWSAVYLGSDWQNCLNPFEFRAFIWSIAAPSYKNLFVSIPLNSGHSFGPNQFAA